MEEESSEKRRERLQAMRTTAAAAAATPSQQPLFLSPFPSSSPSPSFQGLSNPLLDSDERTPPAPRFDFYTDPMAAFSGSKRRTPSAGGGGGPPYSSPGSFSSPVRTPSPRSYPSNRPTAGPRNYHVATNSPPGIQFQTNQPSDPALWRSPTQFQNQFPGHPGVMPWRNTSKPSSWSRPAGGSPGHGFTPNYPSRSGEYSSPGFSHRYSPGPHFGSGRDRGWTFRGSSSNSPRSGRAGGRGYGSYHDCGSTGREPQDYYLKTMVKDPWRKLKPIVGSILVPRFGQKSSWLPRSIATQPKRAKVVESGGKPQLSLAESLALAMEEAGDGT